MKKVLIVTTAALISLTSLAQGKGKSNEFKIEKKEQKLEGKEQKGEDKMERMNEHFDEMSEKLKLTNEQKAQIKVINEDFKKQMQELKGNTGMPADEKKTKRMELVKVHKEKIHAVLTPEQQEQAKAMRKEHRKEHKGNRHDKFEKMTEGLNLTAEQTQKVKALKERREADMQAIRNNTTLTEQHKKEQLLATRKKFKDDLMALLTTEQKQQLKTQRKQHKGEHGIR